MSVCPIADDIQYVEGLAQSPWAQKSPKGITIHYSADGSSERLRREMFATKIGYHFLIAKNGRIIQTSPLDKTVHHAGKAMWNDLSPNRHHIAIAFICWGKLNEKGHTWTGLQIQNPVTRAAGTWEPATNEQEASLIRLLKFLSLTYKISADDICGHDECAIPPGRKADPGGSLSMTMPSLRSSLAPKKPQTPIG